MNDNGKGIVLASIVLGLSLIICTVLILGGLKKAQHNAFAFISQQKNEMVDMLRSQKHELKRFEWNREVRMRNFVRDELKNTNVEAKVAAK